MAVTGVTSKAKVVRWGGATEKRFTYLDTTEAIEAGDLIRINTSGVIKLAEASSAGAVHGIALADADTTAGDTMPILLFANDTVIEIQCVDSLAPSTLKKGVTYTLEIGAAGVYPGITSTTTNGVAKVVDYAATGQPWEDGTGTYTQSASTANGAVHVTILQSVLDGAVA